jgi:hypothetical protein
MSPGRKSGGNFKTELFTSNPTTEELSGFPMRTERNLQAT